MMQKHKVFVSHHHKNDQEYKEHLQHMNAVNDIFIDKSVLTGDIDDTLRDEAIRVKIRDEYLKDSTVTILLVGVETWCRKHVDWEIYSSMYDGIVNKKSGILVINLPSTDSENVTAGHGKSEKELVHSDITSWTSLNRSEYEQRYRFMPARIIDNLITKKAKISVVPWSKIENSPETLRSLIRFTNQDRQAAEYDFSRSMRRSNCNS